MRFKTLVIILTVLVLLVSCEQKDAVNNSEYTSVCRSEVYDLPDNFSPSVTDAIKVDGGYIYINGVDDEHFARICRYDTDGTNPVIVEQVQGAGITEYIINDTETAHVETVYGKMSREKITVSLHKNDNELFTVNADDIFGISIIDIPYDPAAADVFDVKNVVKSNGFYYIASTNKIAVLDETGNKAGIINSDNTIDKLLTHGDDILILSYNSKTRKYAINYLDKINSKIGDSLSLPDELMTIGMNASIHTGAGYDFYIKNNTGLYGCTIGGDITEVANWVNSDFVGDQIHVIEILSPSEFLYISGNFFEENYEFGKLTLIPKDEYVEKTVLTLAKMHIMGTLDSQVVEFNKQSEKYRVIIKDYSAYETELQGTRLNVDIAAGEIPDIFAYSNYPYNNEYPINSYVNQGLFMDLLEMFERDESVSADMLQDIVLNAFTVDGKLYMLPKDLTTQAFIGKKSNFSFTEWTPMEMLEYSESLDDDIILAQNINSYMWNYEILNHYIDYDNKKFNYDDNLKKLISYRAEAFKNYTESNISYTEREHMLKTDKLLLRDYTINSFGLIATLKNTFGDDITYVGFPAMSGSGSPIQSSSYYSIAKKSNNLDGAWDFIKFFLSQDEEIKNRVDYGSDYIPITKTGMEKMIGKYLGLTFAFIGGGAEVYSNPMTEKDNSDLEIRSSFYNGEYELITLTRDEIEELINMLSTLRSDFVADTTLNGIFLEEIRAYYNDIRDEVYDEAIRVIKSRLELYLNEQY